jgi:FKBP-type peptidyl-prolyl cis-trans isomerase FkpA
MKSKISYLIAVVLLVGLVGCQPKFKKMANGMEYAIVSKKKGNPLKYGMWFEFSRHAVYTNKDSMLIPADLMVNQIAQLDSNLFGPDAYPIFKTLYEGDSIIIREKTDSAIDRAKKMGQQEIPWMKKGYYIIQSYTVKKFYSDSTSLMSAQKRLGEEYATKDSIFRIKKAKEDSIAATKQIIEDDKLLKDYLTKNKITATKTPAGVYIEILTAGTGVITDSNGVKINYTGKNLKGKVFDSNTDPKNAATNEPYLVNLFEQPVPVIKGWVDGIKQLGKGAKARLYIPSVLAYGKMARDKERGIDVNENLIFDIEIVDVLNKAQATAMQNAIMQKQQQQMMQMQMQQQMMQQQQQQQQQGQQKGK